jgi:cell division protein FtsQ
MRSKAARSKGTGRKTRRWLTLPRLLMILAGVGLVVAAPLAAGAAYRYVTGMKFFSISDVRVSGLRYVRRDDFIKYIGDPKGKSVLRYDMDGALRRASGHPWIKSAVIRRDFPDAVRFEVVERTPAAVAETATGNFLIDTEGYAVSAVNGPGWEFLPVIEYRPAKRPGLLDDRYADGFRDALELIRVVRREPAERLSGARLAIIEDGTACLVYSGALVKVGDGGYEEKVRRLSEVVHDLDRRGVKPTLIDLRFPGKVVVKESHSASAASSNPEKKGGG